MTATTEFTTPRRRITLALFASALLHAMTLAATSRFALVPQTPPAAPRLDAELRKAVAPAPAREPLIKNTLAAPTETATLKPAAQAPATPRPSARPSTPAQPETLVQRKLARHIFYPDEARARGFEGEVRILLSFDADGNVVGISLAAGSGHPLLDDAAMLAARQLGRLPEIGVREMILPVVFRLQ